MVVGRPVLANRRDPFHVFGEAHRLDDITVSAQRIGVTHIARLSRWGKHDHRDGTGAFVAFDAAQDIQTVEHWKLQIEQDDFDTTHSVAIGVGTGAKNKFHRLHPVFDVKHLLISFAVVLAQRLQSQRRIVRIALAQQYVGTAHVNAAQDTLPSSRRFRPAQSLIVGAFSIGVLRGLRYPPKVVLHAIAIAHHT